MSEKPTNHKLYASVHQNALHFTQFTMGISFWVISSIALTSPRWLAVTHTNTMQAISIHILIKLLATYQFLSGFYQLSIRFLSTFYQVSISYAPVVTLSVVVIAMQLVVLAQGCTLVGLATDVPIASVGVVAAEQGTQIVV